MEPGNVCFELVHSIACHMTVRLVQVKAAFVAHMIFGYKYDVCEHASKVSCTRNYSMIATV
jgi:hypothetical protein